MTKPNLFGSPRHLLAHWLQTTLLVPLLLVLGLTGQIRAQDCSFLSFSYSNAPQPCCYQLKVNNSISECHPFVRVLLDGEVFASWTASAGWTGNQTSPSEIIFTHSSGQVPFGNSTIATLCLPLGATADLGVLWDFTCGIGTGCTTTLVLPDCNDPQDGSISGTLYAECGTSGYSNQPPLANQTVQLFNTAGELLAQEISDANGFYAFYDRPFGQYIVKVVTTPGWTPSVPASGQYALTLNISQQAIRNFGICVKGSISGVAYLECGTAPYTNQTVLANRTVQLFNAAGTTLITQTTTNGSGAYSFANLNLGQYVVKMLPQAGDAPTVPASGQTSVTLSTTATQSVKNFGLCVTGTISGVLYQTCDSVPYTNQPPVPNQLVQLFSVDNVLLFETLSDTSGAYAFSGLPPAPYWARVAAQPGWTSSVPATGQIAVTLSPNSGPQTTNFGRCPAPISGVVYVECDTNAYTNQPLLAGQIVLLYNAEDELLAETLTDTSGAYAFYDLPYGQYIVKMQSQPGFTFSVPPNGQATVTLSAAAPQAIQNFGLCAPSIAGVVYLECDTNQYLNQPLVANQVVQLFNVDNVLLAEYTTGGDGVYAFYSLPPAPYWARVAAQPGWTSSVPANGQYAVVITSAQTVALNFGVCALPLQGCNCPLNSTPGANLLTNPNFSSTGGFTSDYTFDNTGVLTSGEYWIAPPSGLSPCGDHTTGTGSAFVAAGDAAGGAIPFSNYWLSQSISVTPNTNYVFSAWVSSLGTPNNVSIILEANGSTTIGQPLQVTNTGCQWKRMCGVWNSGSNTSVNLAVVSVVNSASNHKLAIDDLSFRRCSGFGVGGGVATGRVYQTCDTVPNPDQPALAGWVVQLLNATGTVVGEQVTDIDGAYGFYELLPGQYIVRVQTQSGWTPKVPASGQTAITLTSGAEVVSNFGFLPMGSISGLCYVECGGAAYANQPLQANQVVQLYNSDNVLLAEDVTGSDGAYSFTNLPCGLYWVRTAASTAPANGEIPVELTLSVRQGGGNFGVCNYSCDCNLITPTVTPAVPGNGTCCYSLSASAIYYVCFQSFEIQVDAGLTISPSSVTAGWTVTGNSPQSLTVTPPANLQGGVVNPLSFCVSGGSTHNILVLTRTLGIFEPNECSKFLTFSCSNAVPCDVGKPRIATTSDGPVTTFTGEVDLGAGTTIVSAVWDFGDGTQDSSCCVGTVSHTYEPGIYTACLTVTGVNADGAMCSDSACVVRNYNPCNDVSASLQSSGLGDCCYTLTVGNTLPSGFTHIEVTLSSGNFSNTQILNNNWLVAINGSTATLTPVGGGYVPVGTDVPLSICDPMGTDPYTVTVSFFVAGGGVCSKTLTLSCSPDDCACTGFANVEFYNFSGLPNIAVTCNSAAVVPLPCIGSDATYQLQGNIGCQGTGACASGVQYQISNGPNTPVLYSGSSVGTYFTTGGFTLPPGTYQLVLTGQCGANTCTCTVNFSIPTGCDCTPACLTNSVNVSTGVEPGLGLQNPGTVSQMWSLIAAPPSASLGPLPKPANFVGALAGWPTPAGSTWLSPFAFNNSSPYTCTPSGAVCSSCDPFVYERCFCLCENSPVAFNFDVFATGNVEIELWAAGGSAPIAKYGNCTSAPNANLTTPFTLNANLTLNKGKYCLRIKHWSTSAAGVGLNVNGAVTGPYLEKDECCSPPTGCLLVRKFNDLNCDGTWAWDTGNWTIQEPTLSSWGFTLTNTSTLVQYTGFTNAVGEVYFCVPPGTYSLVETPQAGWTQTSGPSVVNVNASGVQIVEIGNCQQACTCQMPNLALTQNGVSYPVSCNNPAAVANLGCPVGDVTLSGSFGCENPNGAACPQSPVVWNLYGPNGFVTQGVATGPSLNLQFLAASVSTPGLYTLNLATICQGEPDSCRCTVYWIQNQCTPCCTGTLAAFLNVAQNVQTFGALGTCNLSFQAVGLTNCLQIRYDWGDNTTSGPVGDNVLVSHTYAQTGTYNVCYTIEELDAGGNVCHTYTSCEQVTVICNDCVCGSFSEMFARPTQGGQSIALSCGGSYTFGCPAPGQSIPITGKFECQGANCAAVTTVNWELTPPSGPTIFGSVPAGPYFSLPILPLLYVQPGTYTLVLKGNCGGMVCPPCSIQFTVNCPNPCPCDPTMVPKNINFATALWHTSCKGCFTPIGLNDCDAVSWSVGAGPTLATTVGGQTFCHNFLTPGLYVVTMNVTRFKSDGSVCQTFTVSKTVLVHCGTVLDCNSQVFANPRFSEGAVAGALGNGGASEGWAALGGVPYVLEGQPAGTLDGWAICISGNLDQSDVLGSLEPVCLADSGTVTIRLAGDPIPGCDVKAGRKPPGGSLAVSLFQGSTFSAQNCTDCYRLALIQDLLPLDSGEWVQVFIPYDLSAWEGADTCGSGTPVRIAAWVTSPLGTEQGGPQNGYQAQLDNLCVDGTVVTSVSQPGAGWRSLRIVPNPNAGTFTVELPVAAAEGWQLRVLSATGQVLKTQAVQPGSRQQTVQASELPSGLYLLQVVAEGRVLAVEKWVRR